MSSTHYIQTGNLISPFSDLIDLLPYDKHVLALKAMDFFREFDPFAYLSGSNIPSKQQWLNQWRDIIFSQRNITKGPYEQAWMGIKPYMNSATQNTLNDLLQALLALSIRCQFTHFSDIEYFLDKLARAYSLVALQVVFGDELESHKFVQIDPLLRLVSNIMYWSLLKRNIILMKEERCFLAISDMNDYQCSLENFLYTWDRKPDSKETIQNIQDLTEFEVGRLIQSTQILLKLSKGLTDFIRPVYSFLGDYYIGEMTHAINKDWNLSRIYNLSYTHTKEQPARQAKKPLLSKVLRLDLSKFKSSMMEMMER